MTESTALPARDEVPVEQTWALESIFPSVEAWEAAFKEVESWIPAIAAFEGTLGKGPETLVAWLQSAEEIRRRLETVHIYASLESAQDTSNADATARHGQAGSLAARVMSAAAFAEPEIMAIGFATLREWMEEEPRLAPYARWFERLERRRAHIRSGEVEAVLAAVADPIGSARNTYDFLSDADLRFEPARGTDGETHAVGQSTIEGLLAHPDREVRRTAWEGYADGFLAFRNTFASTLTTIVKKDVFEARVRRYDSSLEAAVDPDHVPVEVYHNVIDVFRRNLPMWHRYWRVRRRAMGLDTLHVHDIEAPLTSSPPRVPFRQAVDWICEGMEPLGGEYVDMLRRGCLEERWVDYAVNRGKRAGAFSNGTYDTNPFILMSDSEDLGSLSTLAHELGHSMHTLLSARAQPYVYSEYSIFAAEVASNFNQALTRAHLFETQRDRDFQLALIQEAMSNFHRYFFIMPTLARFELEMHERVEREEPVNAEILIDRMADLFREGYGGEVAFDHDRVGITWAQFGHLYLNFYVFQYTTGISGAHALAADVLAGREGAVQRYLEFLRAGASLDPLDALRRAGVDLTTPEPVERTFGVMAEIVDRLERLTSQGAGPRAGRQPEGRDVEGPRLEKR